MKLKAIVLGFRGFPNVQGGVETHVQHLFPILSDLGCEIEAVVRARYMPAEKDRSWSGIRYIRVWAPKSKRLEAIVHTFFGVLVAAVKRPDILHIHAIGPALMAPLARLLGLRVVVTHHGADYERQKWGRFARFVLKMGECCGMRYANGLIAISAGIRNLIKDEYGKESALIPNGVEIPPIVDSTDVIKKFGLEAGRYVLLVSRVVPEKKHFDLIEAFKMANLDGWKLAIVGASDHPDDYTKRVFYTAKQTPCVVCTGFQSGAALAELYSHAGVFALPSSHEGLPIALLEALAYGLPVVASDISANLEVGLPKEHYFALGNVPEMAGRLRQLVGREMTMEEREARRKWVAERYDWQYIAERTLVLYKDICAGVKNLYRE